MALMNSQRFTMFVKNVQVWKYRTGYNLKYLMCLCVYVEQITYIIL
jgi:hypothetical protein